jgi:copper(I)-binding protein
MRSSQLALATEAGIAPTSADVDARMATEATTPESRHAWVIAVKPDSDPGAIGPTEAQKAAAKAKLEAALADIAEGQEVTPHPRLPSRDECF